MTESKRVPYEVERFSSSMPADYALAFGEKDVREHARIVARRGAEPVHLELWKAGEDRASVVCVVGDDKKGFLSAVCAAFVKHKLVVQSAQVYTRQREDGTKEVVDLFWVRVHGSDAVPDEDLLEDVRCTLLEQTERIERERGPSSAPAPLDPIPAVRAFFDPDALAEGRYLLIVEAPDYPGLLLTIARTLLIEGMEILESRVHTEAWRARDSFLVCDAYGGALGPERLASVRKAVVSQVRSRH